MPYSSGPSLKARNSRSTVGAWARAPVPALAVPENDVEGVVIRSYPTILLYSSNGKDKPVQYNSGPLVENFISFINEYGGSHHLLLSAESQDLESSSRNNNGHDINSEL